MRLVLNRTHDGRIAGHTIDKLPVCGEALRESKTRDTAYSPAGNSFAAPLTIKRQDIGEQSTSAASREVKRLPTHIDVF